MSSTSQTHNELSIGWHKQESDVDDVFKTGENGVGTVEVVNIPSGCPVMISLKG